MDVLCELAAAGAIAAMLSAPARMNGRIFRRMWVSPLACADTLWRRISIGQ
jgi:hypothetical protein